MPIHSESFLTERRLPNPKQTGDERSEYDRDYARVIHSAALRRLQSKTQVIGLGEGDFYRTRLTHSMEVAQIGCGITRHLGLREKDRDIRELLPPAALMNSICLSHDIGHPPFGHGGEVALNYCMRAHGGFEGNGQTLRILSNLETYTERHGMNLTRRALLGILKYPAPYNELAKAPAADCTSGNRPGWMFESSAFKPPKCYLDTEGDLVCNWLLAGEFEADTPQFTSFRDPGEGKHRKPRFKALDTSIMELADDISYGVHDMEDAISMDLIRRRDFEEHVNSRSLAPFLALNRISAQELQNGLFGEEEFRRKQLIGKLVNYLISRISLKERNAPFQSPLFKLHACLPPEAQPLLEDLKNLVLAKVIRSPAVQQLEFKGQKLVVELFEVLAHDPDRLLPRAVLRRYLEAPDRMRVLCDYVSGLSDNHAVRLYQKIFTPLEGSIFDRI